MPSVTQTFARMMRALALVLSLVGGTLMPAVARAQCDGRWLASPEQVPPGMNGWVYAFAVMPNGDLVAGGRFTAAGGVTANSIARWNGSSWVPLGSGINGSVSALAVLPSGDLVAGGGFSTAGGATVNNIARWNGSSWAPLGSGMNGWVRAVAVLPSGDLVAGGSFTSAGGVAVNRIARWNDSSWEPLGSGIEEPDFTPYVSALAVLPSGDLVAGGLFTIAGGVPANRIARWNGASWVPLGAGVNNTVRALAVLPSGGLVAGGYFTFAGGVAGAIHIARWDGETWTPMGSGMTDAVLALAVLPSGDLVAGGHFTRAGGVSVNHLARWTASSWSPLGSGMDRSAYALAVLPRGELVAGGEFTTAGGGPSGPWARWSDTGVPWVAEHPGPQSISPGQTLTLSATCASGYDFNGPVTFQWQRSGVNITDGPGGASPGGGTVSGASGALTPSGLTATLTITNAQLGDAGDYTVAFSNSCGSETSAAASVAVRCAADFDGNGGVDSDDVIGFFTAWDVNDPVADFNHDGGVDSDDVIDFFARWDAGC